MDDLALIARAAAGDQTAVGDLYDRYGRQVYALACRILSDPAGAEDVTQEVFVKIWRSAARFDPQRGRVGSWILHIAYTTAIDLLRTRRHASPSRFESPPEEPDPAPGPAEAAEVAVLGAQVRAALMRLPPEQRQTLEMAYFEAMSHREIASRLQLPLGTVKGRLRLALQSLRRTLLTSRTKEANAHERLSPPR